ncbi:MAG TPA: LamG-like jellyroll fold domain-containing protein [Balneolaceae bacterium]|nr:LamG-like jellyroll fold domain-containing protein [Balneolaceae bacterium]
MSSSIINYTFDDLQLSNPDGTLTTNATGCEVVTGPGSTDLGDYPKALNFGNAGKAQVNLPLDKLNKQKFCVRTLVKLDAPITARQNLAESNAIPFSLFLQPVSGSGDFKAVASVKPANYGWSTATSEFSTTTLSVGTWYLIDLIYDTDTLGIAVNGNVLSVTAFPNGTVNKGTNPKLFIGTWTDGARNHFQGSMAALQILDGIPDHLEALLDERRSSPEWFITYKHEEIKHRLNLGPVSGAISYDSAAGGYVQSYAHGLIMYSDYAGAAFEMHGAIYSTYKSLSNKSQLGYLVSDEQNAAAHGSRKNLFNRGGMYWSGATGAVPVTGQIYIDYERMGEASAIGLPVTASTNIAGGREQKFQRARMYHKSGAPRAYEAHGAILHKFLSTGGVSKWGFPISNEKNVQHNHHAVGRSSEFEHCTFYWHSGGGAFEVHGGIRKKYNDVGGPIGQLGFPTSDEQNIPGAPAPARCNSFQNGSILWFGRNCLVCEPFKIFIGRLDTQEKEALLEGQNDLYFTVTVDENGHRILNKRFPDHGDYSNHDIDNIDQHLPLTITTNNIHSNVKVTFDVWEDDPFGSRTHMGTYSHTLKAANAWGMRENGGVLNTGSFHWVNSLTWAVQPTKTNLATLSESQKWWGKGTQNRGTAQLTRRQYADGFRDVDPEPEWWDAADWLRKLFYSAVVKGIASGGNCFGMSLEAIYAWKHRSLLSLPLDRFHKWSEIVKEVNVKHEYQVGDEAIWWFVAQFLTGHTHDPVEVFHSTRAAFARGDYPVLCLSENYDFSGDPHTVLPAGEWDTSSKPWKLKIFDPNFVTMPKKCERYITIDPDQNTFNYMSYHGGQWSGGRLYYMPYCVLNDEPRTPVWDALTLLLNGTILILGGDAETESLKDESGVDLNAFGKDAINRLKAGKPLQNKIVPFKGFGGAGSIASEVYLRKDTASRFQVINPVLLDNRLPANIKLGDIAKSGKSGNKLKTVVSDKKHFNALSGRDLKSIAKDSHALANLSKSAKDTIKKLATSKAKGKSIRHQFKGNKKGKLQYAVKSGLNEFHLTAPVSKDEQLKVTLDNLRTPSAVMEFQSPKDKTTNIVITNNLGSKNDRVKMTIDNIGVKARKPLKVNVKPGLGGVEILSGQKTDANVSVETIIGGKTTKAKYSVSIDGGLRLRPSTINSNRELKTGKIETLFGPIKDGTLVKPKG